jgi:hypothetical protein
MPRIVRVSVVIMLHGTAADRTILEPLAAEVAQPGARIRHR